MKYYEVYKATLQVWNFIKYRAPHYIENLGRRWLRLMLACLCNINPFCVTSLVVAPEYVSPLDQIQEFALAKMRQHFSSPNSAHIAGEYMSSKI